MAPTWAGPVGRQSPWAGRACEQQGGTYLGRAYGRWGRPMGMACEWAGRHLLGWAGPMSGWGDTYLGGACGRAARERQGGTYLGGAGRMVW